MLLASLALATGITACTADSDDRSTGGSDERPILGSQLSEREGAPDSLRAQEPQSGSDAAVAENAAPADQGDGAERRRTSPGERSVIQTGNVAVASDDVAGARFDAKELVDRHSGEVAAEETGTDDGEVDRVRMEIRVPHQRFDDLMTALAELGELRSTTRSAEDVSTEVIDTRTRVRSQERSIARIQSLLAQADSLNQVIAIESQLASRQADLESLKAQLTWLQDQTALSTITLSLAPTDEKAAPEEDDDSGFLAGLANGWDGLTAVATGLATGAGTALPFVLTLGVLTVPLWLLVRRRSGRQRTTAA